MEKCSNCNGKGFNFYVEEIICPVCNGKGYVGTKEDE